MKLRKVIIGVVSLAVTAVSVAGGCVYSMQASKPDGVDEPTFEAVLKVDKALDYILEHDGDNGAVEQEDIDLLADYLRELTEAVEASDLPLSQVHYDIGWKIDLVMSSVDCSACNMINIFRQYAEYNDALRQRIHVVEAVG